MKLNIMYFVKLCRMVSLCHLGVSWGLIVAPRTVEHSQIKSDKPFAGGAGLGVWPLRTSPLRELPGPSKIHRDVVKCGVLE